MTNTKNTKRALLSSVMALFLCFAMLLGTTFAWFTDSMSSINNIIKSGNLDVELEYARTEGGKLSDWKSVSGSSDIFDPKILWEPGRVEVVYLKVSNPGTLALKYKLLVNILGETIGQNEEDDEIHLSDYLVFKVVNMDDTLTLFPNRKSAVTAAGTTMGIKDYISPVSILDPDESDYLALIIYMPESVGNVANYRGSVVPCVELGIDLFATQAEYEKDSFGTDYDKNAYFPKTYGLLVDQSTDLYIEDYDFELWGDKRVDALVHVTDGSVVNIYGNTNRLLYCGGTYAAPAISADKNSVVNIYGGSYSAKDAPIINVIEGSKVNIYRGIFRADAFTGDADHTNLLINCDEASGCEIKIYGGTFVNFDPSTSGLGNLIDESCVILTTPRDNGEIWYTVVQKEYQSHTPIFTIDDAMKALNNGVSELLFACDIDPVPDTENLMYSTSTNTMKFSGRGSIITISGTGTSPAHNDYGYVAFIPIPGYSAEISDMKFVGEGFVEIGHHKQGGGTYTAKNITIENLIATLHINNGGNPIAPAFSHYGKATLKDCVMTGTTTKKVGYTPYDAGFVNGTTTLIDGGKYGTIYLSQQAHVTIIDAKIDIIDSCAINYIRQGKLFGKLTVGDGAKVGTLRLTPGSYKPSVLIEEGAEVGQIIYDGDKEPTIVIEEGAKVGKIIYKGVSYTLEEWLAR